MKLLKLSMKNIVGNVGRSITLFSFLFLISMILVVCNAFIFTAKDNMQTAIRNALSGEIQVRPISSEETDLFPMGTGWDNLVYMKSKEVKEIERFLDYQIKVDAYTPCIRGGGKLSSEEEETSVLVMGIDLKTTIYQNTLLLEEGRYATKDYEVVLSTEQAEKLQVQLGDTVELMMADKNDELKGESFKVVGIGNVQLLSNFGLAPVYISIDTMRGLGGFHQEEATDLFIYCPVDEVEHIKAQLEEIGQQEEKHFFKVSTWKEMGGFVNAILLMLVMMLYIFIGVFIIIVGVLILNIVTIVVTERRQEIGSMRAIGYSREQVLIVFVGEMIGIAIVSSLLGCIVGLRINHQLAGISLHIMPPLDYMLGSYFRLKYEISQGISVLALMVVFTFVTSFKPCLRAVKERPVDILRG